MRQRTSLTVLTPLLKQPFFTSREALALGISSAVLAYYNNSGALIRIGRGLYRKAILKNKSSGRWDDLARAVASIPNGVICLISALNIYDLTEELPRQYWIGIPHETSAKSTRQTKITRFRNINLGKTEILLDGRTVPIFDRERTIIDAFRLLSRETAIKALKAAITMSGKNRLDIAKLETYAKKLRFEITPYLLSVSI